MPFLELDDKIRLYYEEAGSGPETIVFSHGLLWSTKMWHKQLAQFKNEYRVIAYDHRGQGQSDVPSESVITMDQCYEDGVAVIEKLKLGPVHWVGLSMGGFTGIRIAARRPELIKTLTLMGSGVFADEKPVANNFLALLVNILGQKGIQLVNEPVMKLMTAKSWLNNPANKKEADELRAQLKTLRPNILKAVKGVTKRKANKSDCEKIKAPTLILVGAEDVSQPTKCSKYMHEHIAGSEFHIVQGSGHTMSIEAGEKANSLISEFLHKNLA